MSDNLRDLVQEGIPLLIPLLNNLDPEVRSNAAISLLDLANCG